MFGEIKRGKSPTVPSRSCPYTQRGAALIMGLVILLVLTLLGVTAMRTTSLEEKMAGNVQEATRAFETAESGLVAILGVNGALSLTNPTSNTFYYDSNKNKAKVDSTFLEFSPPKRDSGFSAIQFNAANFEMKSEGTTTSGARSTINQGLGQIVPK